MSDSEERREVVLLNQRNCPLCEDARAALSALSGEMGFAVREVDVRADPALRERYRDVLPVVRAGGYSLLSGRIAEAELRAELERAFGPDPRADVPPEEEMFLPALECPVCEGDLESRPRAVACLRCGAEYPRIGGVLMLMDRPEEPGRLGLLDRLGRLIGFELREARKVR
jgi:glutaredoxin